MNKTPYGHHKLHCLTSQSTYRTKKNIDTSEKQKTKDSHKLSTLVLNPEHAVLIKLIFNGFLIWRKGNLQASQLV